MKKSFTLLCVAVCLMATSVFAQTAFVYNDYGKRDPFWQLVTSTGAAVTYGTDFTPSELLLEGIISDTSGANLAIINGQVVKTEEKLGQYTVTKIDKDSITLTKDQKNFVLKLKKEE